LVIGLAGLSFAHSESYQLTYNNPIPLTNPTNSSTIPFETSSMFDFANSEAGHTIIFNVNGTYAINQTAWLKILNNKGDIVYNFPINQINYFNPIIKANETCFPIKVYLADEGK
jgi:hypothetical protein